VVDSKDGCLIPSSTTDQYDERSAAIGKRLGWLKAEAAFGPERVSTASARPWRPSWKTHSV
jgi:hypothetical protein